MILADYIEQHAINNPNKPAIICNGVVCTYQQLAEEITKTANQILQSESVDSNNKIHTFRASQDVDFIVKYFALHKAGYVAAPLEKDTPQQLFDEISAKLYKCEVPSGTADILYTTGTTGKSKGVMISHKTILANAENLIEGQGFSSDLLFIITGPLNHIGSLSKLYPVMMLGATIAITEGMKNVSQFFEALELPYPKAATFLVPSAIRILLQLNAKKLKQFASKIDFIETGAAPISHADMLSLCQTLPNSRLYNTYASTETGIISTYNFNDGKCIQGCLGRPMKHSKIVITESGLISCMGDTLMSGYAGDKQLTQKVLSNNIITTSDYGKINEDGMLILYGREDDVINIGGYKVAPTEVENVAMSIPQIKDCICIPAKHTILGTVLKLLYVSDNAPSAKEIANYMKSRLENYKVPFFYEPTESIKRTYNGKTDRKYYKENFA